MQGGANEFVKRCRRQADFVPEDMSKKTCPKSYWHLCAEAGTILTWFEVVSAPKEFGSPAV